MSTLDYIVFVVYGVIIVGLGLWFSGSKGKEKTSEDYFLASKSLPWWAIGASLIAANISAEQMIGMSGQGFGMGLAIASYELMAAISLVIVAKYFLPVFIDRKLFTIPQFVEVRYSKELKTILAIFWLALFMFVNLTTVLLLGAQALDTIIGTGNGDYLWYGIIGLAVIAVAYSLQGGLSAVAWTDVLQVALPILGGIITSYLALSNLTPDGSAISGLKHLYNVVPEKFDLIISDKTNPAYKELPGIAVIAGGMWIANLYYWGFNQYIIQRALAAKNIKEAQKGLVFAGFLKLLIPLIIVIPGIAAYVMYAQPAGTVQVPGTEFLAVENPPFQANDRAYPWLISSFVPQGIKGLVVAALAAAILSSLASMMNSISTIFTMDIYTQYINKNASEKKMVQVGRLSALVAISVAIVMAPVLNMQWLPILVPALAASSRARSNSP